MFPEAMVQTCIVHLLRHSLDFVTCKDRKPVAAALKGINRAIDPAGAEAALAAFEASPWGANTSPSARIGSAPGARRCHSMPSPSRVGGCFRRRMRLRR